MRPRSIREDGLVAPFAGPSSEGTQTADQRVRIVDGWVGWAFVFAAIASVVVFAALSVTYGAALEPVVASWLAVPFGMLLFLFVSKTRAPAALEAVRTRQLLGAKADYQGRFDALEARFHHPASLLLGLVPPLVVFLGYVIGAGGWDIFLLKGPRVSISWPPAPGSTMASVIADPWQVAEVLEVGGASLIAAVAGLGLWRIFVIGLFVHELGRTNLRVQVGHPDGCGGLEPLGRVCLENALVLALPSAVLGFWIVRWAVFGGSATTLGTHVLLLLLLMAIAAAALVLPIWSIHQRLDLDADDVLRKVEPRTAAIDGLARELAMSDVQRPPAKLAKQARKLAEAQDLYRRLSELPRWPLRVDGAAKFAAAEAPALLGVVVSVVERAMP